MITAIYGIEYMNTGGSTVQVEGHNALLLGHATIGHPGHDATAACFFFKDRQQWEQHRHAVFEGRNKYVKPVPFTEFRTGDERLFVDLGEAMDHERKRWYASSSDFDIYGSRAQRQPLNLSTEAEAKIVDDAVQRFKETAALLAASADEKSLPEDEQGASTTATTTDYEVTTTIPESFDAALADLAANRTSPLEVPETPPPTLDIRIAELVKTVEKPIRAKDVAERLKLTMNAVNLALTSPTSLVVKGQAGWLKLKEAA